MKTKTYKQLTGLCLDLINGTESESALLEQIRSTVSELEGTVVITLDSENDRVTLVVTLPSGINYLTVSSEFVELESVDNEGNQTNYIFQHIAN